MFEVDDRPRINAKTFQEPLALLAEAIAQMVWREGRKQLRAPDFVADDLFMMIRQSLATYRLTFYINADERREQDCYWNASYGVVTAPSVRSMIDCLYNVTAILQDPAEKGAAYKKSGFKRALQDIDEDQEKYGGRPEWDDYIKSRRDLVIRFVRLNGFTEQEVREAKGWPTLGNYIQGKPETLTPHQRFLKKFTYLQWRQYSALSHAAFESYIGELPVGAFFIIDTLPHEVRPKVEASYRDFLTRHVGRAATVLLCLVTELQAYFRFDGADINKRIQKIWDALMGLFEAKELYAERYSELMRERGIATQE